MTHGALVLAEGRVDLARERDVQAGRELADDLARAPLVRGIEEGEQEADRDGLDALGAQLGRRAAHGLLVERLENRRRLARCAR